MAGISFCIRSSVEKHRLEVLMQGWQPKTLWRSRSSSISSCTRCSLSFISPRTLREPGVMSRKASICSAEAKDSREEPMALDSTLVRKGLSGGSSNR